MEPQERTAPPKGMQLATLLSHRRDPSVRGRPALAEVSSTVPRALPPCELLPWRLFPGAESGPAAELQVSQSRGGCGTKVPVGPSAGCSRSWVLRAWPVKLQSLASETAGLPPEYYLFTPFLTPSALLSRCLENPNS